MGVKGLYVPLNLPNGVVKVLKFGKVVQPVAKGVSRNVSDAIGSLAHRK